MQTLQYHITFSIKTFYNFVTFLDFLNSFIKILHNKLLISQWQQNSNHIHAFLHNLQAPLLVPLTPPQTFTVNYPIDNSKKQPRTLPFEPSSAKSQTRRKLFFKIRSL